MRFFSGFVHFLFHIGYFGPLLMGILDSSFLILPFGNDLLVVGLIAHRHEGFAWYVLSAATGSTIGAGLLALVCRAVGEERIRRVVRQSRYEKVKKQIDSRSGFAVMVAGLAPPPFPFTTVIAAVSALGYPLWKTLVLNFLARGARFTILGILAIEFGRKIMRVIHSAPFEWSMAVFIAACFVATGFSVAHWIRQSRRAEMASQPGP